MMRVVRYFGSLQLRVGVMVWKQWFDDVALTPRLVDQAEEHPKSWDQFLRGWSRPLVLVLVLVLDAVEVKLEVGR